MDGNEATRAPESQAIAPEAGADRLSVDKLESKAPPLGAEAGQNGPKSDDGTSAAQAQVAAVVGDDSQQAAAATTADPSAATPLVAADVDVIEPEWVKKAEEAVAKHRDDPRAEEKAVEEIQIEYLKKRYNLDVKSSDEKP